MKKTLCIVAVAATAASGIAAAGPLENMERERAIMLETMLSGDIMPDERHARMEVARTRLIDLERMVLRDKSLIGRNTPTVLAAFENYDLTFLVHAATEKGRTVSDHWLSEIGLSSQYVLNGRMGRR